MESVVHLRHVNVYVDEIVQMKLSLTVLIRKAKQGKLFVAVWQSSDTVFDCQKVSNHFLLMVTVFTVQITSV